MGIPWTTGKTAFGPQGPGLRFAGDKGDKKGMPKQPDGQSAAWETLLKSANQSSSASGDRAEIRGKVEKSGTAEKPDKSAANPSRGIDLSPASEKKTSETKKAEKPKSAEKTGSKREKQESALDKIQRELSKEENLEQLKYLAVGYGIPLASSAFFLLTPLVGFPAMFATSYIAGKKAGKMREELDDKAGIIGDVKRIKAWLNNGDASDIEAEGLLSQIGDQVKEALGPVFDYAVGLPLIKDLWAIKPVRIQMAKMAARTGRQVGKLAFNALKGFKTVRQASPFISGFAGSIGRVALRFGLFGVSVSEAAADGKGPIGALKDGVKTMLKIVVYDRITRRIFPGGAGAAVAKAV